jgi:hypothetical protein
MKLSLLPTTTITTIIILSLFESAVSSSSNLHRVQSDEAVTTNTHIPSTGWQRRSLLIDEAPGVGLEDVDVLLIGGSSLSMSFSYNAYNNNNNDDNNAGVVGNDDVDSIGGTSTTTTTTTEVVGEDIGEIVVIHHPSTTIITTTPSFTSNTQTILPPTTTTIHETFASIPTYPAPSTTTTRSLLPLISIAGGLVAIGAVIGGVYRTKKQKKTSKTHDEKSIQSINSKSTDESEMSVSLADEENDNSRISSTTTSSLVSMAAMSTLVSTSTRVDRRASI